VVGDVASKNFRGKVTNKLGLDERPITRALLSGFITFNLVCLAWVFFRANSIADAFLLLDNLAPLTNFAALNAPWAGVVSNPAQEMLLSIGLILLLAMVHLLQEQQRLIPALWQRPFWLRWAPYLALALAIMNLGISEEVPFIYLQF
jgi:hypothetical protein